MHGNVHIDLRSTYVGACHNILCVKYLNIHIGAHLWAKNNNREMNYLENRKRRYCNTIRNDIFSTRHIITIPIIMFYVGVNTESYNYSRVCFISKTIQ